MDILINTDNILLIPPTKILPKVEFHPEGVLEISGRIITDHLCDFFQPLFNWVENATCERVHLKINLDYLNSNGTFLLVELMRQIEANQLIKQIIVDWYHEDEDEEHYELGELIHQKLKRTVFEYISYS